MAKERYQINGTKWSTTSLHDNCITDSSQPSSHIRSDLLSFILFPYTFFYPFLSEFISFGSEIYLIFKPVWCGPQLRLHSMCGKVHYNWVHIGSWFNRQEKLTYFFGLWFSRKTKGIGMFQSSFEGTKILMASSQ